MDDRDGEPERKTVDLKSGRDTQPAAAAPTDSPQPLFAGRADRFDERGELGRGGMGRVVEAYDRAFGRTVAVKHLLAGDDVSLARFEREAVLTARLEHPGIVPVHDAGRSSDGMPFYVMKRVDGDPLDRLIDRQPFAKRITRIPNVLAACDAVAYAHSRGVIHRDLKPSNILVGPFGETLVIDWGLARSRAERAEPGAEAAGNAFETRAGTVSGTPAFMPPEQARGEQPDERADVFALGATLFYVLAAAAPYASTNATELVHQVGRGQPPDWSRLPGETPPELRAIVEKAMSVEPAARYANAGALAADLRSYVDGQLVAAYSYGAWERVWRFVRRHRAVIAVAAVAAVVIAVISVISVRRVVAERDDARAARRIAAGQRDHLLVQHARELAETDPTAAVVALRALPADSAEWPGAAAAAAIAEQQGIAIGFLPDGPPFRDVVLSPDGKQAVARNFESELFVYDLTTGTHRDLHARTNDRWLAWLDSKWLVAAADSTVLRIDATSGAVTELAVDARVQHMRVVAGRAWVATAAGTLYVIDAATTTPQGRATGGVDASAAVDDGIVIEHDHSLVLWTKDDRRDLGIASDAGVASDGHLVAAHHDGVTCTWELATPPVKRSCTKADPTNQVFAVVADRVWSLSLSPLAAVNDAGGVMPITGMIANAPGFPMTLISASQRLWQPGRDQWRQIGGNGTKYTSTAVSADGRVFAAVTATGELRVWQLAAIGLRRLQQGGDRVAGVARGHAWTVDGDGQVYDHELATDRVAQPIKFPVRGVMKKAQLDGDWLAVAMNEVPGAPGSFVAYDLRGGHTITQKPGEDVSLAHGTLLVMTGSDVSRVEPDGTRVPIAHLPIAAVRGAVLAGDVLAVFGGEDGRAVCERAGGEPVCTTLGKPIEAIVPSVDGTVWISVAGEVWRWRPGESPRRIHPELGFRGLAHDGVRTIAYAAEAIVDLDRPDAPPVATPAITSLQWLDHDRVFAIGAGEEYLVIDVRTGAQFPIPFYSKQGLRAGDGTVVGIDVAGVWIYTPDVPTEPAALARWLVHATNATAVPGSDAITWPH